MKKSFITYLVLLSFIYTLAGCDDTSQQPAKTAPAKTVKPITPAVVAPEVAEEQEVEFVYSPIGKRDPFENPLQAIVEVSEETGVPLTPLQKFDLEQLRLIGVIVGRGEPRAMVIAPDGKSFILRNGTKIGKNNGSVIDITTESVRVNERYFDFTGEVKSRIQEIKLPKQGGVK